MRTSMPSRALVLGPLAVLALTAGCTGTGPDEKASASWSAHTETLAADEEAEAVQAAEQAVRDYYQVRDHLCLADPPNVDPSCYDEVSVDDQLTNDRATLEWVKETGRHHVGGIKIVGTERVVDVQLSGGIKEITQSICIDATDLDIIGPDGMSLKPSSGTQHVRHLYVVRKYADRWQVADILDDPEGETC